MCSPEATAETTHTLRKWKIKAYLNLNIQSLLECEKSASTRAGNEHFSLKKLANDWTNNHPFHLELCQELTPSTLKMSAFDLAIFTRFNIWAGSRNYIKAMSHSASNRTLFDLHVTYFYETFYRHSTNRNTLTYFFFSVNYFKPYSAKSLGDRLYATLHKMPGEIGNSFCLFLKS